MLTLNQLGAFIPGSVLKGAGDTLFTSVSIDTRTIKTGALYFCLRGERFDGHDFAENAASLGAAALVVEKEIDSQVPCLIVPDTRQALGQAASGWRDLFDVPLIAVTGSNGKTTVTQMLAAILAAHYGEDEKLATAGNLNNDIGLPLMLLRLGSQHKCAVLELGMNHPGEISYLAGLAKPTVVLVNNAQREHQEFMDSVEATAKENGSAIESLPEDGIAAFPASDEYAHIWRDLAQNRKVLDFSVDGKAAVNARAVSHLDRTELMISTPVGTVEINLPMSGGHNIHNALAATTAALATGISLNAIRRGLEGFSPVSGRGVRLKAANGSRIIDDSYNANPDSVRAATDLLAAFPSKRILVLGDMGEVGTQGPEFHREIGHHARESGIESLLTLGELSRFTIEAFNGTGSHAGRHFENVDALIAELKSISSAPDTILVKGSRFMRMERIVKALTEQ